ncbi:MAG TPA: hypothetical protein PLE78_08800 [Flavobacteriales bacterium]|nr:hypothetical protein [Flavobacteriales bacterium]HQW41271.1 hypothetical protein [Flavobacteriales bacterium]
MENAQQAAKEIETIDVKAIAVECHVLKDEDLVKLVDSTFK